MSLPDSNKKRLLALLTLLLQNGWIFYSSWDLKIIFAEAWIIVPGEKFHEIFAHVILSSLIHLIARTKNNNFNIVGRDLKEYADLD